MNFYHIIDHTGYGTLHKLILPLCSTYNNHKMYTPYLKKYKLNNDILNKIVIDKKGIIVIHSTGREKNIYLTNIEKFFPNKKIYIFMHVSLKNRMNLINYLHKTSTTENIIILTPSQEVTKQYIDYGFKAITIQLGILNIEQDKYITKFIPRLSKYYNKIITTCASNNNLYNYAKGIDIFEKIILNNNWKDIALIAGTNSKNFTINCKNFSERDFLNILSHSKVYIQLSRYEAYNITAIQAKKLKIPTLLLNSEGTFSCMNGYVYDKIDDIVFELKNILNNNYDKEKIEACYIDSISRETIQEFKNSFDKLINNFKEDKNEKISFYK